MDSHKRFFFALLTQLRFTFNVGLIERPLVLGLAWASFSGEYVSSLGIGVFFELFWLDLFPAGTFIPPNYVAATIAPLAICHRYGLSSPAEVLPVLALGMAVGKFGQWLEQMLRNRNDEADIRLHEEKNFPRQTTTGLVAAAIARNIAASFLFMMVILIGVALTSPWWHPFLLEWQELVSFHWWELWFCSSIGGILAIRWRRVYGLMAAGVIIIAMSSFLGSASF
ncbi:MAG: PTS sugar transporter subunit IIC [Desulfovibrio sp.]|uniref:PTS sugar transporter subunit IIC n=1 Tax=Desulfovibrio sp. 7SRBS1 TaxID=3378064 RepID=UPI003B3C74DC